MTCVGALTPGRTKVPRERQARTGWAEVFHKGFPGWVHFAPEVKPWSKSGGDSNGPRCKNDVQLFTMRREGGEERETAERQELVAPRLTIVCRRSGRREPHTCMLAQVDERPYRALLFSAGRGRVLSLSVMTAPTTTAAPCFVNVATIKPKNINIRPCPLSATT